MKKIVETANGENFKSISLGSMNELSQFILNLAPGVEIPGKVFLGTALNTTGAEISFQSFAPNSETGFFHTHKNHEEIYIFISGNGEFQVDNNIFPISEGSVVRVSPKGKRSVRNNGNTPLVMICIQYKSNTFTEQDAADGNILNEKVEWK
ncbi:MAG: cupin domain-containing protein [Bacteroidales bacterium]|nr:cupin domain-containing protein [Bacteroidales bacterium]